MVDFLDLSTHEKRVDWLLDLTLRWGEMKRDIDNLFDVCAKFINMEKDK